MSDAQIDLEELRNSIRDVLVAEASSVHVHKLFDAGNTRDQALEAIMADLGWPAIGLDEAAGGLGLGIAGLAVLYEELGRVPVALPTLPTQLVLCALGSADQLQDSVIEALAGGREQAAWIEPGAGLTLEDGQLSGTAQPVLGAGEARWFLVSLDESQAVLVDANAPGVTVSAAAAVDATRSLGTVAFDKAGALAVAVDGAALRRHAWLGIAADCLGGAASILERTVEYLKVRVQFDKPIGSFQALKHRAANLQLKLENARGVQAEALAAGAGAPDALGLAALAKATAAEAYAAIAADAVQLHGGIGFTWEHDCHVFLKRAQLNLQVFGSPEALLEVAARQLVECA